MDWLDFVAEQYVLVSILAVMVAAFVTLESRKGGKTISYHEATRKLNDEQAILVDVRDSGDFKAGHITGAISIPFASLEKRADELEKHKAKQIILVDKAGQHANAAGKILRDKEFEVVRLQGGMMEWNAQNLPLVKG